ncbi:MAG: zinc metallopeptidase [Thermoguttaceae bacterium]|nr:zinc metallopeptidase [Thermoguttaceae bacterium]
MNEDNLLYLVLAIPPALIGFYAQNILKSRYAKACQAPCNATGAAAARAVLDSAGLQSVAIERVAGVLSDHYDPRAKVLRLSENSYSGRNLAAIGVAAHEAGHALQDAQHYKPMLIRQTAVPLASFGSNSAMVILLAGVAMNVFALVIAGIVCFGFVAFLQIINLPVEYNASARAKERLVSLGFVNEAELPVVKSMLGAAALTYVAAMMSAVSQLLYFVAKFLGSSGRRR